MMSNSTNILTVNRPDSLKFRSDLCILIRMKNRKRISLSGLPVYLIGKLFCGLRFVAIGKETSETVVIRQETELNQVGSLVKKKKKMPRQKV